MRFQPRRMAATARARKMANVPRLQNEGFGWRKRSLPAGSGLLGGIVFATRGCLHLLVPLPQAGVAAARARAPSPQTECTNGKCSSGARGLLSGVLRARERHSEPFSARPRPLGVTLRSQLIRGGQRSPGVRRGRIRGNTPLHLLALFGCCPTCLFCTCTKLSWDRACHKAAQCPQHVELQLQ